MEFYYLNKKAQLTGEHEVHKDGCQFLPSPLNRDFLGLFSNCVDAVAKAKEQYTSKKIDGCYHCSRACHTR